MRLPALLATEFPEVRGARQAAAERAAGRLPGAVPRRRPGRRRSVRAYADEVKAIMRANPNLRGVNDNWNESVKALRLEVDQDKARALGVTSQAHRPGVAHDQRRAATIGQYREGDKLIDIVLRQPRRRAQRDLATWRTPTCRRPAAAACRSTQIARRALRLGAGRALARGPRLRGDGAGRHRRGPAGRRP